MSGNRYGKTTEEIFEGGRSKEFQQDENVKESLREQIPKKLLKILDEEEIGQLTVDLWNQNNSQRSDWLERQRILELEYEEFIDPLYDAPMSWSSTLHYPVTLTIGKTYHSRMYAAITQVSPPFTVKPRKAATVERAQVVQDIMQYADAEWANYYQGTNEVKDQFVWDWVMRGTAILKARWDKKFVKFRDVEDQTDMVSQVVTGPDGLPTEQQVPRTREVEVDKIIKTFDGPVADCISPEDLAIIGHYDPQRAEAVIERTFMTRSELLMLVDRGIFDEDRVEDVLRNVGPTRPGSDQSDAAKHDRTSRAGESSYAPPHEQDEYEILEGYLKVAIDDTGIDTDVVVFVEKNSSKILRATYLHRVMETGERPYFKADFHRRRNATYGCGLPEIIYSLSKEIDAVRNMRMDFGLLSTLPFGYYRATSSMDQETIPIEPGSLVPLDDPSRDIFFPNLGNRTVFGFQEEQSIYTMIERYTGTSDLQLGILGAQGAARTATGARAVLGESNANLNVFLSRLQRPLAQFYRYMLAMVQKKIKPGFTYRLMGPDGKEVFNQLASREEIAGQYDFMLDANSANSNPQVQLEVATQILQLTGNPLDFQLQIVTPQERYEALKNYYRALGVKDFSRFVRKPAESQIQWTPGEMIDRILNGADVPLSPASDLQGFIAFAQDIFERDDILGQFSGQQTIALVAKMREAQQLLDAMQQQQAQMANMAQQQANAQAGVQAGTEPLQGSPVGMINE